MDTGRPTLDAVIRWMEQHQAGAVVPGTSRMLRAALDYLRELAQGNDRRATWYDIGASGAHCSRCHYRAPQQSRYCPHCGAKMERREKP